MAIRKKTNKKNEDEEEDEDGDDDIYWTDGIMEPAQGKARRVTVPVKYLPNGNLITDRDSVPVWWAPLAENRNNESYGSTVGFRIRYIHAKNYLGREEQSDFHRTPSQAYVDTLAPRVSGLTIWGNRDGVMLNYNEKLSLNGARIVGFGKDISKFEFNEGTAKEGTGLDLSDSSTFDPASVKNVSIDGNGVALALPVNGVWSIEATSLTENKVDMLILEPESNPTQISLQQVSYTSMSDHNGTLSTLPAHVTSN